MAVEIGFHVETIYGKETRQPLVKIDWDSDGAGLTAVVTPEEARRMSRMLHEAAEAALVDGFLVGFIAERVGLPIDQAAAVLGEFRAYRRKQPGWVDEEPGPPEAADAN